jgi:hypothetical protein
MQSGTSKESMLWSESKISLVSSGKGGETPNETETTLLFPN